MSASLALIALAVATSAPLLHARAHEAAEAHHHSGLTLVSEEDSHHDVHPFELHDDWGVVKGVAFDLSPALPSPRYEQVVSDVLSVSPACEPEVPISCRGHSPPNSARAPPLV